MGIDPGSQKMGFAVGDGTGLPICGAWRFDQTGDDLGAMLAQLDDRLEETITQHGVQEISYEAPILLRHDTLGRLRKTLSLGAHVEFVCHRMGIPCSEVSLRDAKKELAGFGQAEKSDMVSAAVKLGVTLPATKAAGREDAADALAVFLLLLRKRSRGLSYEFDRRLYGVRGQLAF